jgi:hypothetical protein
MSQQSAMSRDKDRELGHTAPTLSGSRTNSLRKRNGESIVRVADI